MNKIIIYGAGMMFERYKEFVDFKEVVCIVDQNRFQTPIYGCEIIRKDRIMEYDFDYIVVFNKWHTDEIRKDLVDQGVAPEKILHFAYYIFLVKHGNKGISTEIYPGMKEWLSGHSVKSIIDINGGISRNYLYTKDHQGVPDGVKLYNRDIDGTTFDLRPYRDDIEHIEVDDRAIVCLDFFLEHTLEEFQEILKQLKKEARYLVCTVPYKGFHPQYQSWDAFDIEDVSVIWKVSYDTVMLCVIDLHKMSDDLKIYVVTHTMFEPPEDPMYQPVFAGKGNDNVMGIPGEQVEDNITDLNGWINECTVLYYIWKHTTEPYVGINHYRRYFSLHPERDIGCIIHYEDVIYDLWHYDMITAPAYVSYPLSIKEQIKVSVNETAFEKGYEIVREVIERKQPAYLEDFDTFFAGNMMYPRNMFITNRKVLNEYCTWLFDILPDACRAFEKDAYDSYSSRMIGFMAERLLTLYIIHNRLKIKEIPIVELV